MAEVAEHTSVAPIDNVLSLDNVTEVNSIQVSTHRVKSASEDFYNGVAIGVLVTGIALLVLIVVYYWIKNQMDQRRRLEMIQSHQEAVTDVPPSYSEVVLRTEPPEYKESLMQEINPSQNPGWAAAIESGDIPHEVRETLLHRVHSQTRGFMYNLVHAGPSSRHSQSGHLRTIAEEGNRNDEILPMFVMDC